MIVNTESSRVHDHHSRAKNKKINQPTFVGKRKHENEKHTKTLRKSQSTCCICTKTVLMQRQKKNLENAESVVSRHRCVHKIASPDENIKKHRKSACLGTTTLLLSFLFSRRFPGFGVLPSGLFPRGARSRLNSFETFRLKTFEKS